VNFSGGQVVRRALLGELAGPTSASPSVVNISGGGIEQTTIWDNADVNFSGGDFGVVAALSGSQVSISGGRFSQGYQAGARNRTEIRGGVIPRWLVLEAGSAVTVSGGEFLLDGAPVSGMVNVPQGSVLTGTMMDGTAFVFSILNGDSIAPGTLQLNEFPLPPATPREIRLSNHDDQSPLSIRAGQTLTVSGLGGTGRNFTAVDARLVVDGGFVESGSEFVRSDVDINSGFVNEDFNAFAGSSVRIRGGQVRDGFRAYVGSEVHVIGTEFKLADPVTGAIITDLTPTLIFGEAQVLPERDLALVVRLADGTYFDLNTMRGDYVDVDATLTITRTPEPTSLALLFSMTASFTFAATSNRARR
jgi:hypothetical protein